MYEIIYDKRILKDIKKIPSKKLKIIFEKIEHLKKNPKKKGIKKLLGFDGYRMQVGEYRVLFQIDTKRKIIKIFRIKHRKEVYRKLK